jgi:hypothetical protein
VGVSCADDVIFADGFDGNGAAVQPVRDLGF